LTFSGVLDSVLEGMIFSQNSLNEKHPSNSPQGESLNMREFDIDDFSNSNYQINTYANTLPLRGVGGV
jgi:hypothetical protein